MTRFLLVGAAAFTMLSGYARAEAPAVVAKADAAPSKATADCPMGVAGSKVSTVDTADGTALTFSTTAPDKVAELRRRVHAAAEMHNKNHAAGGRRGFMMGDDMMGGVTESGHMMGGTTGGGHMAGGTMMPQSHATVADVDGGACLTVKPGASADLKELQLAMHARAERMQQHGCGATTQK
ncbi:MAG: hypothetical protein HZB56_11010 [Deltaproteobacteria bacterium]|nr:hypothetical protein [Deltaproteobacteria bacterium]